jgi:hypothetical protein
MPTCQRLLRPHTVAPPPAPPLLSGSQEFDANYDGRITFDEFNTALGRWVDEKLASSSEAAGGGNGFAGRYSALLDPRTGGPAASLLEDLPADDLAALQVGSLVRYLLDADMYRRCCTGRAL